jgi:glycosidase
MFTFPGAPCIYYGNEVGLSGAMDPDCRRVFPEPSEWNQTLLAQHKELIALRDRCPALRTGDYRVVQASGSLYAFTRSLGPDQVFIAVNVGRDPITCDRPTAMQNWPVVYGSPQSEDQITLPPQSACILTNQP